MLRLCALLLSLVPSLGILSAQDYLIGFKASGAASTINNVKIENLTQATELTISGSDRLHLVNSIVYTELTKEDLIDKITVYPNPVNDYARMQFFLREPAMTEITMFDFTGSILTQNRMALDNGQHSFGIYGVKAGTYFIRVSSGKHTRVTKLLCSGSNQGIAKISYENSLKTGIQLPGYKGAEAEFLMQYDEGDKLKFTGYSGIFSTVVIDVPTESKDISFEFIKCTDGDTNNYPVVKIGGRIWMAENLKTSSYKDGTSIPHVENGAEWANLTAPGYCWYDNEIDNKNIYGGLYNWYAVNTGNLCPAGWHVPSDDEWHQMILYLDGNATLLEERESRTAADNLKETGITHWNYPSAGTDDVGFKALPGGYRRYTGDFGGTTDNGNWRTSTQYDATRVWYRYIFTDSGDFYRKITNMQAGYSVRCIKD